MNPFSEGVILGFGVVVPPADGIPLVILVPPGEGWTVNKQGNKWTFKDNKDGSLGAPTKDSVSVQCNNKTQTCTVKADIQGVELGEVAAGEIMTTVEIGDDRFEKTQTWRTASNGKKLVTP